MNCKRPLVRYHGGKWMLATWIISHFPEHRIYVEPYGGGGSVLLRKPRCYAEVYNDLDHEIVNLFQITRDRGQELKERLRLTPFSRAEFDLSYQPIEDPIEKARRTVVRAYMGFASAAASGEVTGFRATSYRAGTSPAHDWANYPDAMEYIIERLRGVVIENRDAAAVMASHDREDTLHYVDPPYVHSTRSTKVRGTDNRKSYRFEMTDNDHLAMATAIRTLTGMVIVSGHPCDLYDDELFTDWQRISHVACADGARDRIEVLWLSPNIQLKQMRLIV